MNIFKTLLKPKILLRVTSVRREAGYCILLKALFEKYGFDVFLSCTRNIDFALKFWRPDIVILGNFNGIERVKKICPDAFFVYLETEGFLINDTDRADDSFRNLANLKLYDLILLWGDVQVEGYKKYKDKINTNNIHAIGNPKMDVIRYLPLEKIRNGKKTIGFITRFSPINHHEGVPVLRNLQKKPQLDYSIHCLKSYNVLHRAITYILDNTNYSVSIRPHPNESIDTYYKYVLPSFKKFKNRIEIDDNLFISEWIFNQKYIVSTSTTTFIESYVMKTPMINLDFIACTDDYSKAYSELMSEWINASFLPKSLNELVELVKKKSIVNSDKSIEKQLKKNCNFNKNSSALHNCVKILKKTYKRNKLKLGIPLFLLEVYDTNLFKRIIKKNPNHKNFSYGKSFHKPPSYLNDFVSKILKNDLNKFKQDK